MKVAAPPAVLAEALSGDAERAPRVRAGRNLDDRFVFQRGHFNLRAQRRLHETDGHLADQIIAVALENFMLLDVEHHVQIPGRAAAKTRFPIARGTQARTRVHPGGNPEFDFRAAVALAFAVLPAMRKRGS